MYILISEDFMPAQPNKSILIENTKDFKKRLDKCKSLTDVSDLLNSILKDAKKRGESVSILTTDIPAKMSLDGIVHKFDEVFKSLDLKQLKLPEFSSLQIKLEKIIATNKLTPQILKQETSSQKQTSNTPTQKQAGTEYEHFGEVLAQKPNVQHGRNSEVFADFSQVVKAHREGANKPPDSSAVKKPDKKAEHSMSIETLEQLLGDGIPKSRNNLPNLNEQQHAFVPKEKSYMGQIPKFSGQKNPNITSASNKETIQNNTGTDPTSDKVKKRQSKKS